MDVLDGENDLCDVEARLILLKDLLFVEVVGEVASWAIIEDHVQIVGSLKAVMHFDHIGMRGLLQNVAFGDGVLQVLISVQECFFEDFHRVFLVCAFSLALEYFAEGAVPQNFQDVKRLEADSLETVIEQNDICLFHLLDLIRGQFLTLLHFLHSLQLL